LDCWFDFARCAGAADFADAADRVEFEDLPRAADRAEVAPLPLVPVLVERAEAADLVDLPRAVDFVVRPDFAVVLFAILLDFVLLVLVLGDFLALADVPLLDLPALPRFPAVVRFAVGFRICPSLAGVRLASLHLSCEAIAGVSAVIWCAPRTPGCRSSAPSPLWNQKVERRRWRARVKPALALFRYQLRATQGDDASIRQPKAPTMQVGRGELERAARNPAGSRAFSRRSALTARLAFCFRQRHADRRIR
jgi:hypothetical protein